MAKKPNASEAQDSTAPAVDPQKQYLKLQSYFVRDKSVYSVTATEESELARLNYSIESSRRSIEKMIDFDKKVY